MVSAYCLISTEPGRASEIYKKVGSLDGVNSIEAVTGAHDLVARVEVDSMEKLTEIVFSKIRGINGVTDTSTLTVVDLE